MRPVSSSQATTEPRTGILTTTLKDPVRVAIIGGTGLSNLPNLTPAAVLSVPTPWGMPSSPLTILHHRSEASSKPTPVAFLARHGPAHALAPHEINSRANMAALRRIGVRCIVAFSAVGSLREEVRPRDFVLPDQVIDRTKGIRPFTFFEGGVVAHVGFADPFDDELRGVVAQVAATHGVGVGADGTTPAKMHEAGTLVCMEGPAFSTRAESNLYRAWGGSVINMSALPEAKLAREAELGYAMICMATDYDCWHTAGGDVSVEMVMGHMHANAENARRLVARVLDELSRPERGALVNGEKWVGSATAGAGMTKEEGRPAETMRKLAWLFPGSF